MGRYETRDVHFCATCQWIKHTGPGEFTCSRLGYRTQPRWKFNCWSPRDRYRPQSDSEKDDLS
jgi:hypothetical protein